jgi:hypothetical protein
MEKFILFCLVGSIIIGACNPAKEKSVSSGEIESAIPFDTLEKQRIDTIIDHIHKEIREQGEVQKIPYAVYDPTDTIFFFVLENNAARISLELNLENGIDWPTFYVYDGDLINVRYRYFHEDSTSSKALEVFTYLKDGKIVYCHERGTFNENGETLYPGSIRNLPFELSTRTPEEIKADYQKTWEIIIEQMKMANMLPSFLSS